MTKLENSKISPSRGSLSQQEIPTHSALRALIDKEKEAARFGLNWTHYTQILDSINSECEEVKETIEKKEGLDRLQEEVGDILHGAISLCVFLGLDPEEVLQKTFKKFDRRMNEIMRQAKAAGYESLAGQPFDLLMEFWEKAKKIVG